MECVSELRTRLHCNALLHRSGGRLLLGQYEHSKVDDRRFGGIDAATVDINATIQAGGAKGGFLKVVGAGLETPEGVFDIYSSDSASSSVACFTDGTVAAFADGSGEHVSAAAMRPLWRCSPSPLMATSAALLCGENTELPAAVRVLSTHHKGLAAISDPAAGAGSAPAAVWQAHLYDAWCSATAATDSALGPAVVFTGGDDGRLRAWDSRALPAAAEGAGAPDSECPEVLSAASVGAVTCEAGVVSIVAGRAMLPAEFSSSTNVSNLMLVGSYDEQVRLFDCRSWRRPVAETAVGGGAWRLRPTLWPCAGGAVAAPTEDTSLRQALAIAAMHGGALVLGFDPLASEEAVFAQLATFHYKPSSGEFDDVPEESKGDVLIYDVAAIAPGIVATADFYRNDVRLWTLRDAEEAVATATGN